MLCNKVATFLYVGHLLKAMQELYTKRGKIKPYALALLSAVSKIVEASMRESTFLEVQLVTEPPWHSLS